MTKQDQIKALGDAKRAARNHSDGGVNAHQAPKGAARETSQRAKPAARVTPSPSDTVAARNNVLQTVGATASVRDGIIKRSRGRPKIKGPRPWDAAGISRTTYYRDKRRLSEQRSKGESK
jgi:hypothetical protein